LLVGAGLIVFIGALAYLVLLPVIRLQTLALEDGGQGYRDAIDLPGIGDIVSNTAILAIGAVAISMTLGTALAYAVTRLPRRLRWLQVVPVLPVVLPPIAAAVGWTVLLSPGPGYLNGWLRNLPWWQDLLTGPLDIYSMPWIVILTGINLSSFVYLFMSAGFRNINGELIEAAMINGSSPRSAFFRVTLPLLRPSLFGAATVALLLGLGNFTFPLFLGQRVGISVLTTAMYTQVSSFAPNYALASALGAPLLVVAVAVLIIQGVGLGDQTRFVTHSGRAFRANANTSRLSAVFIAVYGVVVVALPIFALTILALSPFWTSHIEWNLLSFENFRVLFDQASVVSAIRNSVLASLFAVLVCIPVGFVVALLVQNRARHRVAGAIVNLIVSIPLAVPAVIFGLGFLFTYSQGPIELYGSRTVFVLVYITLMLPFTTRMQISGMAALGDTYIEASRIAGASALRTNLRILVPLMRSTMAGAGALMFVLLSHEFTASLFVRSATTQVMGTVLYDQYTGGSFPAMACIALIMAGVTTVGLLVAVKLGGSKVLNDL
jgi:iron(III) transport system permease protein